MGVFRECRAVTAEQAGRPSEQPACQRGFDGSDSPSTRPRAASRGLPASPRSR